MNRVVPCHNPAPVLMANAPARLIRRARQAMGLTQRELGERVGLPQSTMSRIENGDSVLEPAVLAQLAAVLEIGSQGLRTLLDGVSQDSWRQWVWLSRRPPKEKLLLLALIDGVSGEATMQQLEDLTGFTIGTLRAAIEGLAREGLIQLTTDARRQGTSVVLMTQQPERLAA
ncbi:MULTISPECIES: helix-turn-helix domain-containing protein [Thiorhodovibrio]|uniref:helix-turn-helix domain-containing protein n=1 Tax=Thiorhodovibrio TaxID=61593 RepID=UPI0019145795|nr:MULTISPECIES: helix-turn-helix transcriptional regulator [Thiorhodovibrio]MBK5969536.1 transcription factor, MBF1 [Thiorhodovibrio winogradskyi]WPL11992.1 transcriptional regulator, y4mF family [Thiorhodovibrio litoralis]